MQFQVPQFIETEDKIVGPLTIKQFIFLGSGAGLSFFLFFMVETGIWVILTMFIAALVIALAFVKVNGRPFVAMVISATRFIWRPQTYVWQPENPRAQKSQASLEEIPVRFSIQDIMSGAALRSAWRTLQTGSKSVAEQGKETWKQTQDKYEIFRGSGGARRAARRIDYR